MIHNINQIAKEYSILSNKRKDYKKFNEKDFIEFAKQNENKYSIIVKNDSLFVTTWYFNDLVNDYRKSI